MAKEKEKCCCKCKGAMMLALGVLVILNALYTWLDWGTFVGAAIGIKGLLMLVMPCCQR